MKKKMTLEEKIIEYEPEMDLEWKDMDDFGYLIIENKITTNTTTLRRINTFKSLVFGGNQNGIVGYGKGSGIEFDSAVERALKDLHQNLVCINLDPKNTFPVGMRT